ncbi:phosphatase PAP2 family protein [Streptomyces sp. NPDC059009]|uniref:phosphatase PAP2 family protein n=1 Tax=Streptomyces sp. NPDC059009 TaxID=3346694 RepID=UPI0036AF65CA
MTVAVPVLAAVLAYTAWRGWREGTSRWWLPPVAAALAMAAVPLLVAPLKALVDRPGPPGMDGHGGFYPSGHAATAAVAYGACALVVLPLVRSAYLRRELVIGCVLLNAGIGLGLVRRGYHWPLDVIGSWCLCVMLLQVTALACTRLGPQGAPSDRAA